MSTENTNDSRLETTNGMTFDDFMTMIEIFIKSNQPRVPYQILKSCGYSEDLRLKVLLFFYYQIYFE